MSEFKSPFTERFEQDIRELIRDELSRHDAETVHAMTRMIESMPHVFRTSLNPERPDPST